MNGIGRVVRVGQRQRGNGVELGDRREPRIGVLGRNARQRQHADEMHDAAQQHAREDREQQRGSWAPHRRNRGHRRIALGARRDADRRIVEPQHQRIALDAAGRQPVAGARPRGHPHFEAAVGAADDFLAGEAVALQRIGDQTSLQIVKRQGPEPRRGVTPLTTTSQRPSSGRLRSSVVAENATPSPAPIGNSPLRAMDARE